MRAIVFNVIPVVTCVLCLFTVSSASSRHLLTSSTKRTTTHRFWRSRWAKEHLLPLNGDDSYGVSGESLEEIWSIRGGASDEDDDEDDEAEEDEDEGFDDMFDDADIIEEDDFSEESLLDRAIGAWKKGPPVTKLYLSSCTLATALGYVMNSKTHEFPAFLSLDWNPTLFKLQLWRPFTAFLNLGAFNLGWPLTAHFVWTYMSTLERMHHNRPYDFWILLAVGCVSMLTGYSCFRLSPKFLGHNLSTFLVYIWARYHEGVEVNMFEMFNTRAELLPWFFLGQTFLLEGELPLLDFLGIVFGHIYYHFYSVGVLRAPPSLKQWYEGDSPVASQIRQLYKRLSADFEVIL